MVNHEQGPGDQRTFPSSSTTREVVQPPAAAGLYDPAHEHDACGVGFVVDMKGRKSHGIVQQALQVLMNLEHRGACGCEVNTGDGAGILIQMPDRFLRKVAPGRAAGAGRYGAGLVFLPHDARPAQRSSSCSPASSPTKGSR